MSHFNPIRSVKSPLVPLSPYLESFNLEVNKKSYLVKFRPTELTPALYRNGYDRSEDEETRLIDVPDVRQRNDFECGQSATQSVCRFYGVGTDDPDELNKILGTNKHTSTHPFAIRDYLQSLGLQVEARDNMTLADLRTYWDRGWPVICPVQEYGDPTQEEKHPSKATKEKADFDYGHYVVFIGGPALGMIFVQDPSIDNVLEGEEADAAKGRMMIPTLKFLKVWHDQDKDGNKFVRYGIAVGPPRNDRKAMVTSGPYSQDVAATTRSAGNVFGQGQVTNLKIPMENNIDPDGVNFDSPKSRVKALEPEEHEFSSTQLNVTSPSILRKLEEIRKEIADEDLAEKGRDEHPHVTVKFGLHTDNVEDVKAVIENWLQMRGFGPIKAKLGPISLFPSSENNSQRGGDIFDVLKVDVESPELENLNKVISENLEHTDTHPEYHPHLTLAYLKPGAGWLYVQSDPLGWEVEFPAVTFSDKSRNYVQIDLTGSDEELGWRCENPPCEWSMFAAGDENMDMEKYPKPVIHDQEPWERAHPDRWERSEKKSLEVKSLEREPNIVFWRQTYDRWRTKPDILGERRLQHAFDKGRPPEELAAQNDEEFRLTREGGTQERFRVEREGSYIPPEAGLTPGEELEDTSNIPSRSPSVPSLDGNSDGNRCPDGSPINPRTRTCAEKSDYEQGYPGIDEMHIEQDDRMVGGQRRGKGVDTSQNGVRYTNYRKSARGTIRGVREKDWRTICPDGTPMPPGTGSCQGREYSEDESWDGVVDKDNKPGWDNYPDYAPVVGLDIRDPDEREEPIVGHLFPNKYKQLGLVKPSPFSWWKALQRLGYFRKQHAGEGGTPDRPYQFRAPRSRQDPQPTGGKEPKPPESLPPEERNRPLKLETLRPPGVSIEGEEFPSESRRITHPGDVPLKTPKPKEEVPFQGVAVPVDLLKRSLRGERTGGRRLGEEEVPPKPLSGPEVSELTPEQKVDMEREWQERQEQARKWEDPNLRTGIEAELEQERERGSRKPKNVKERQEEKRKRAEEREKAEQVSRGEYSEPWKKMGHEESRNLIAAAFGFGEDGVEKYEKFRGRMIQLAEQINALAGDIFPVGVENLPPEQVLNILGEKFPKDHPATELFLEAREDLQNIVRGIDQMKKDAFDKSTYIASGSIRDFFPTRDPSTITEKELKEIRKWNNEIKKNLNVTIERQSNEFLIQGLEEGLAKNKFDDPEIKAQVESIVRNTKEYMARGRNWYIYKAFGPLEGAFLLGDRIARKAWWFLYKDVKRRTLHPSDLDAVVQGAVSHFWMKMFRPLGVMLGEKDPNRAEFENRKWSDLFPKEKNIYHKMYAEIGQTMLAMRKDIEEGRYKGKVPHFLRYFSQLTKKDDEGGRGSYEGNLPEDAGLQPGKISQEESIEGQERTGFATRVKRGYENIQEDLNVLKKVGENMMLDPRVRASHGQIDTATLPEVTSILISSMELPEYVNSYGKRSREQERQMGPILKLAAERALRDGKGGDSKIITDRLRRIARGNEEEMGLEHQKEQQLRDLAQHLKKEVEEGHITEEDADRRFAEEKYHLTTPAQAYRTRIIGFIRMLNALYMGDDEEAARLAENKHFRLNQYLKAYLKAREEGLVNQEEVPPEEEKWGVPAPFPPYPAREEGKGEGGKSFSGKVGEKNIHCPDGTPMSPNSRTCSGREAFGPWLDEEEREASQGIPFTEEQRLSNTLSEPPKGPTPQRGAIRARYPNRSNKSLTIRPSPFGRKRN